MSQMKVKGSVLLPRRNSATVESVDIKRKKKRPEFTTAGKALHRNNEFAAKCDYPSPHFRTDCLLRADSVTVPKCNRVDRIAREITYQSILNDQLVNLQTFLIRIQAADTAHDAFEILKSVVARSQETIDENIRRCENHLEAYQGDSITHRVSAYAQISADITKQVESVLFTEKEGELKQYKKQQEKREEEIKRKDSSLAAQIANKTQENESLRDDNIGLSNQIKLLEKKKECLLSDVDRAHTENRATQELLVEMRMQGLDFKSEVDKRCHKVIGTIREQMGYVPEAAERQLLQLLKFLPPGDPKYDTARILGDPRSIRKLRIIDEQEVTKPEGEKWLQAVSYQVGKGESDTIGQRNVLLNNQTVEEIKKKKLRRKALSTPLSVSAVADMNREADSILHLLRNSGLANFLNSGKCFQENLFDFKEIQKITEVEKIKKKKKVLTKKKKEIAKATVSEKEEKKMKIAGPIIIPKVKELRERNEESTEKIISSKQNKKKAESPTEKNVKKTVKKSVKSESETESVNAMDTSYENFRYSVNMLRESIVQGTAATKLNDNTNVNTSSTSDARMLDVSKDDAVCVDTKTDSSHDVTSSVISREMQGNMTESTGSRSTHEREREREMRLASIARYSDSLHDSMIDKYEDYADIRTTRPRVQDRPSGLASGVNGTDPRPKPRRTEEDWLNWARRGVRSPLSDSDFEDGSVGRNIDIGKDSDAVGDRGGGDSERGGEREGRRKEHRVGVVIPHGPHDDDGDLKPWGTGSQAVVKQHSSSSSGHSANSGQSFSDSDSDDGSENEGEGRGGLKVYDLPDDSILESRYRVHDSNTSSAGVSSAYEASEEHKGEDFSPADCSRAVEHVDDSDGGELYISTDYQQPWDAHDRGREEEVERIERGIEGTAYPDQYSMSSVGDGLRMGTSTIAAQVRSHEINDSSAANSLQQESSSDEEESDEDDDDDDDDGGERYTSFPSDDTVPSDLMGYRGPSSDLLDTYMKEIYGRQHPH